MKALFFAAVFTAGILALPASSAVLVTGGNVPAAGDSGVIVGFNPAATPVQDTVGTPLTGTPIASGIGAGFAFNGVPVGFITLVDSNFIAVFTNQFSTNFVALPFASTNLAPFAGRLPLGNLPPQMPLGAATNSVPGPAPAVPPQTPTVASPPPTLSPVVPVPGQLPPTIPPAVAPTGRLTPPTAPNAPVIPPAGVPTPSPTPIPPQSTPVPPTSTPVSR